MPIHGGKGKCSGMMAVELEYTVRLKGNSTVGG